MRDSTTFVSDFLNYLFGPTLRNLNNVGEQIIAKQEKITGESIQGIETVGLTLLNTSHKASSSSVRLEFVPPVEEVLSDIEEVRVLRENFSNDVNYIRQHINAIVRIGGIRGFVDLLPRTVDKKAAGIDRFFDDTLYRDLATRVEVIEDITNRYKRIEEKVQYYIATHLIY